jgi:predicted alpha/beta superfamily hydrolase
MMKWIYRSGLSIVSRCEVSPSRRFPIGAKRGRFKMFYDFSSRFVPKKRNIVIFLPPHYWSSKRRFPVVYFHDGNNLFDPRVAFLGNPWGIDYYFDRAWKRKMMEEFIVVGIYNTVDRHEEYTPSFDLREKSGGMGALYLRFIGEELKPVIDKKFRTLSTPRHTCIAGSSLGGLISLYGGFSRPDIFGKVAAISPSIWWDNRFILNFTSFKMSTTPDLFKNLKLWIDMGTEEGGRIPELPVPIPIMEIRYLKEILKNSGFTQKNLGYLEVEGGHHNESDWGRRSEKIFSFLFAKSSKRRKNISIGTVEKSVKICGELSVV